jgi:hypothetical protein
VFRSSLTIRLKILQGCHPLARQHGQDHECCNMPLRCQDSKFFSSRVESDQVSLAIAFQGSISQWPDHKRVGQPLILIGSCSSKLFTMPYKMPLKIIAVFKRHGVGNVSRLYISWDIDCKALVCDDMEQLSNPDSRLFNYGRSSDWSLTASVHVDVHGKGKTPPVFICF